MFFRELVFKFVRYSCILILLQGFLFSPVVSSQLLNPNNLPITRDPQLTLTTSGEPNSDIEYNLLGC